MYGLPTDLDLSCFVGTTLNTITFAAFNIYFGFDAGRIRLTVMSSFQHQQKQDIEGFRTGVVQSAPVSHSALMSLLEREVIAASGDDEGTLSLSFDDGQVLRVFENTKMYEQYIITVEDDEYVV